MKYSIEQINSLLNESKEIRDGLRKVLGQKPTVKNKTTKVGLWIFITCVLFSTWVITFAFNRNNQVHDINEQKISTIKENNFDFAKAKLNEITSSFPKTQEVKVNTSTEEKDKDFDVMTQEELNNTISIKKTYLETSYEKLSKQELKQHFTGYTTVIYPIRVKLERFIQDVEGQITEQGKINLVSSGGFYIYKNKVRVGETKNNETYSFNQDDVKNNAYMFIAKDIYNPIIISSAKRFPKYITDTQKQEENNANKFKGILEFVYNENSKSVDIINELDIEQYIRGIGESASWTAFEKMKMQSILARSYAYFYMYSGFRKFKDANYILTDSPANSQKYMGAGVTNGDNWQKASKETMWEILVDKNGDLFIAPYSTCSYKQADGKVRRKTLSEAGWSEEKMTIDGVVKLKFGKDVLQPVDDTFWECKEKQSGGHGVWLSGNGAEHMASKLGKKALEIIQYYYKDVSIKNIF